MDMMLKGKVAVVTGAAGGVGAGIAKLLAAQGVHVAVADRNFSAAQKLAGEINGLAIAMDVSNRAQVEAGLQEVFDHWGGLHILVSNVGLTLPDFLADIEDADIETTFKVNMQGSLNVTRAATSLLKRSGWGRLIYIGSGSGIKASSGLALYSASKYFLHGLCVAAGLELGSHHITANIICPSDIYPEGDRPAGSWQNEKLVNISLQKEGASDLQTLKAKRIARTPAGRACQIDDVANLAVFLASPRADFINAQVIGVNGGGLPN